MNKAPVLQELIRASHDALSRTDRDLAAVGLSLPKLVALQMLTDAGGALSLGELAGRLSCARSNITQLVDRLEADGFVTRGAHPSDRRGRCAVLTKAGRAACLKGAAVQRKSERAIFGSMTADETRQLVRLMKKVEGDAR